MVDLIPLTGLGAHKLPRFFFVCVCFFSPFFLFSRNLRRKRPLFFFFSYLWSCWYAKISFYCCCRCYAGMCSEALFAVFSLLVDQRRHQAVVFLSPSLLPLFFFFLFYRSGLRTVCCLLFFFFLLFFCRRDLHKNDRS